MAVQSSSAPPPPPRTIYHFGTIGPLDASTSLSLLLRLKISIETPFYSSYINRAFSHSFQVKMEKVIISLGDTILVLGAV